jgi:hypothetical protein
MEALLVEEQGEGFYAVLLPGDDRVLITNDTGRRVLELCDGGRRTEAIMEEVTGLYPEMETEKIQQEVNAFLIAARDKGVVSW